jgi:integrase
VICLGATNRPRIKSPMLYDQQGNRKYLTAEERRAFMKAAQQAEPEVETFCLTLAYSGARISEVLALTPRRIDFSVRGITFESLKKRRLGIFRTIPVPEFLLERLNDVHGIKASQSDPALHGQRIWSWCRTTAWQRVKEVMAMTGITGEWAVPKGLRHGLGVEATTAAGIPLNIVQRWLGHSRIDTTAIYANAVGREERALATRTWTDSDPPVRQLSTDRSG